MNTTFVRLLFGIAATAFALMSCEDTGVFAGSGSGGNGGTAGVGGGEQASYCQNYCQQMEMYGCTYPDIDCPSSCQATFDGYPGCSAKVAALFDCQLSALPTCPTAGTCEAEQYNLSMGCGL